jgi:GNAT superfamily N-acetyltransferase
MVDPKALIKASLDAGKGFLPLRQMRTSQGIRAASRTVMVPIRSLGANHRERIASHLKRAGRTRPLPAVWLCRQRRADPPLRRQLDFERDEIFGIYNRRLELIAMAHLAFSAEPICKACAEFGVSVLKQARGRGYGARLFDRAVMHARNEGWTDVHPCAEREHRHAQDRAQCRCAVERDGSETEACLRLPPATWTARMTEIVEEHLAQTDYRLKCRPSSSGTFWPRCRKSAKACATPATSAGR